MNSKPNSPTLKSWIILFALTVIWGSSYILIKKGLEVFPPAELASLRITVASLFLFGVGIYNIRKIPRDKLKIIFLAGLIGNFIPAYLFAFAQTNVSSSLAGIVNSLTPLFTMLVSVLVFKLGITKTQVTGLLIGLAGCISLSFINDSGGLGELNYYILLIVLATILYALNINIIKSKLSEIDSLVMTSCAMMFIGPLALAHLFTTDFLPILSDAPGAWQALGYVALLGIGGTAIALLLFNRLIQMTNAVFAATVTYLMPVVAVIWGVIDGERLFIMHFVGMVLIIAGVYITNRKKTIKN